jgi:predicted transcriptional regulator
MSTINQLHAWEDVRETLGDKQKLILNTIKQHQPIALFELVKILNKPINEISGRVSELRQKYKIQITGHKINPDSRKKCSLYSLT